VLSTGRASRPTEQTVAKTPERFPTAGTQLFFRRATWRHAAPPSQLSCVSTTRHTDTRRPRPRGAARTVFRTNQAFRRRGDAEF